MKKKNEPIAWLALSTALLTIGVFGLYPLLKSHALSDPHEQGPAILGLTVYLSFCAVCIYEWRKSARHSK